MSNYQIWLLNKWNRQLIINFIFGDYKDIFGNVDLNRKCNGYEHGQGQGLLETIIYDMKGKQKKILEMQNITKINVDDYQAVWFINGKGVEFEKSFDYKGMYFKYFGRL